MNLYNLIQIGLLNSVLILVSLPCFSEGANILFFYVMGVFSHRVAIEPLAHELAARGHTITFLSPIPPVKINPKIQNLVTKEIQAFYNEGFTGFGDTGLPDRLRDKYSNFMVHPDMLQSFVEQSCEIFISSMGIQKWLNDNQNTFDLMILNAPNKCGHAVGYKFNIPVIESSPTTFFLDEEDVWGIPLESSSIPRYHIKNVFTQELTFFDRLYNTLNAIYFHFYANYRSLPKFDERLKELLQIPDLPPLEELVKRSSLFFVNQHYSDDYPRSLPPSIIPVGGMHCAESNGTLPQEMEDFIAGAGEHGFVYVSFGSLVKMSKIPEELLNDFFDAVRDLKIRFLWKWDADPPSNLPSNIFTSKWFPQQDALAHPKCKGFVSQGGLMSLQQGIFHATPMIILPIVFDQPYNAKKVAANNIGIHLELSELTAQNFKDALIKLASDETIISSMKARSREFKDRPMSPVDTAAWWVEYTLRHKDDISHMKPLGVHQTWWQRRLLDIWAFLYTVILLSALLVLKSLCFLVKFTRSCLSSKQQPTKRSSNNKQKKT